MPCVLVLYTIGHSARTVDEFVNLLRARAAERIVDIRTIPRSRHNPQSNRTALSQALRKPRISYRHLKALGGLRRAKTDSPSTLWPNASFRGFADYMRTTEFD